MYRPPQASGGVSTEEHPSRRPLPVLSLSREIMAHFTGKWPGAYRPRWRRRPWWWLVTMLLSLNGGAAMSWLIITGPAQYWPGLVISWMLTVHGARKAQLVICHHAVHGNLTGRKTWDWLVGEILTTVLTIQSFHRYYQDHVRTHHGSPLATRDDPDVKFLLAIGFRPGMRYRALWTRLYKTVVSPSFHYQLLQWRLRENFTVAPRYRCLLSGVFAVGAAAGLTLSGSWLPWLVAWGIPIFPLYHVATLLQFVSEHRWLQGQAPMMHHA